MGTKEGVNIEEAMEDDADWFEVRFLTWFWDGVDRLADEERWRNAGKQKEFHHA